MLILAFHCPAGPLDAHRALLARQLVSLGADLHARDNYRDSAFDIAFDAPGLGGSAGLALLREPLDLGARPSPDALRKPSREKPSEELLLFVQSLRDQAALEASIPAASSVSSPRL